MGSERSSASEDWAEMTPSQYLRDFFPYEHVQLLLSLHAPLERTEVALRGESFFSRHNCARDAEQLRELVTRPMIKEVHFGGVWPEMMSKRTAARMRPVARPFVLDLDLDDFPAAAFFGVTKDDQEGCDALLDCVLLGARVLERTLRDVFGFEKTATFYSGRRGVHLWVLDKRAFELSAEARSAVVSALSPQGGTSIVAHPSFSSAVDLLVEGFPNLSCWKEQRFREAFAGKLDFRSVPADWVTARDPWKRLLDLIPPSQLWMTDKLRRVVVAEAWPRVDAGAAAIDHLIKSPYSPHSSTGRIAVAVTPDFRPKTCPRLSEKASISSILKGFPLVSATVDPMEW